MKAIVWTVAVATWLWWSSSCSTIAAATAPSFLMMVVEQDTSTTAATTRAGSAAFSYTVVKLSGTLRPTNDSYNKFIEELRSAARGQGAADQRHGIPVLRRPSAVLDSQRFVLAELTMSDSYTITLGIDVTNMNLVGYKALNRSYFLRDAPPAATFLLFTDTLKRGLAYGTSYADLEGRALDNRANIELGMIPLSGAVLSLYKTGIQEPKAEMERARALIVCIQMVLEAARYKYIQQQVAQTIAADNGQYLVSYPNGAVLSFEDNWAALSSAIQQSGAGGAFTSPVQLQKPDFTSFQATRVTPSLVTNMALMPFVCSPSGRSSVLDDGEPMCADPEVTVSISGRNGLCIEVSHELYYDNKTVTLWPCKDPAGTSFNQLWTLRRDGTIRSNGWCLAASGPATGSHAVIRDCSATGGFIRWQVWDNGTIINVPSMLALSASSPGEPGSLLTLQSNTYAASQGWQAGNNSHVPFVTSIVGYKDLCLQAQEGGTKMWLEKCRSGMGDQQWALYPDGTIRPQLLQKRCVTSAGGTPRDLFGISDCSPASSAQRWLFRNDGAIYNLQYKMVMDVYNSDPSVRKIILHPFAATVNQKWVLVF